LFYGYSVKTTLDVPDRLYRQIKARAALKGQTIKSFFLDAIRAKLVSDQNDKSTQVGWRAVYGKGNPDDVANVQRMIDDEFSRVRAEDWE
jgi:hypothetical protein